MKALCRWEDHPEDGLNEINNAVSETLINALSKLNQTQDSLDKELQTFDDLVPAAQMERTTQRDESYVYQHTLNREEQFPAAPYAPRNNYMSQNYPNSYRRNNFRGQISLIETRYPNFQTILLNTFIQKTHPSQVLMPSTP